MNESNKHSSLYPTNFSQPNQHIGSTYHNNNHLVNSKSNSSPSLSSNSSLALFDDHEDEDDLNVITIFNFKMFPLITQIISH